MREVELDRTFSDEQISGEGSCPNPNVSGLRAASQFWRVPGGRDIDNMLNVRVGVVSRSLVTRHVVPNKKRRNMHVSLQTKMTVRAKVGPMFA